MGDHGRRENGAVKGGSRFVVLGDEHDARENGEMEVTQVSNVSRQTREGSNDASRGKGKKGKYVEKEASSGVIVQGQTSNKSRPAKTTFGELFEYQRRTNTEEALVPQTTTLDPRTNSVVRVERHLSKIGGEGLEMSGDLVEEHSFSEQRRGGLGGHDTLMMEPDVHRYGSQELGRPPDANNDMMMGLEEAVDTDFEKLDAMDDCPPRGDVSI